MTSICQEQPESVKETVLVHRFNACALVMPFCMNRILKMLIAMMFSPKKKKKKKKLPLTCEAFSLLNTVESLPVQAKSCMAPTVLSTF